MFLCRKEIEIPFLARKQDNRKENKTRLANTNFSEN